MFLISLRRIIQQSEIEINIGLVWTCEKHGGILLHGIVDKNNNDIHMRYAVIKHVRIQRLLVAAEIHLAAAEIRLVAAEIRIRKGPSATVPLASTAREKTKFEIRKNIAPTKKTKSEARREAPARHRHRKNRKTKIPNRKSKKAQSEK